MNRNLHIDIIAFSEKDKIMSIFYVLIIKFTHVLGDGLAMLHLREMYNVLLKYTLICESAILVCNCN
jgi:hypothetical protein